MRADLPLQQKMQELVDEGLRDLRWIQTVVAIGEKRAKGAEDVQRRVV